MWFVDDIEIRDVRLDFSSSSGGHPRTKAIYSDDRCLVNALKFANLKEDPAQLIVCESCGVTGCESGGWVHFRRIGDFVVFIPAFRDMLEDEWGLENYSPPDYVSSHGVSIFRADAYERLCSLAKAFPVKDRIPSLIAAEAVWLLQWEAPLRILGRFPQQPLLAKKSILAVAEGELEEGCDRVEQFLSENLDLSMELSTVDSSKFTPVEFYLDGPGFPAWSPVARSGDRLVFHIESLGLMLSKKEG